MLAAFACLTLVVACTTTSYRPVLKNVGVYPGTRSYARDLRDIEETSAKLTSSIVIAGESIPNDVLRFPGVTLNKDSMLVIDSVTIMRIDTSSAVIVSKKLPSVSATIPTKNIRSISSTGTRLTYPSWNWWLLLLIPIGVVLILALTATDFSSNSDIGVQNGCLFSMGFFGTIIGFFVLASKVGLSSRAEIIEAVEATWMFLQ